MELINNKYKLLEKIGEGSFGSIYKGENIRTNEYVAIKIEPIQNNYKLLKNKLVLLIFNNELYIVITPPSTKY